MEGCQVHYQYRPLDPQVKEIRLLRNLKTESNDPITLELRHAQLDGSENFYALSYCWGEGGPDHKILIRDESEKGAVFVPRNLSQFLEFAYETTHDWSFEWIWIDQICIDQEGLKERGHQVRLMGELYSVAKATVIWPGLIPAKTDLRSQYDLTEEARVKWCEPVFTADDVEMHHLSSPISELSKRMLIQFTYQTWTELCCNPYWKRVWIIQEIVLASHEFIVIDGRMWRLRDLCDAVGELILPELSWGTDKGLACGDEASFITLKIHHCLGKRFDIKRDRCLKLEEPFHDHNAWGIAVSLGVDTECSLQFDRIYGLMGLATSQQLTFEPDYTITQTELLRRILKTELNLLCQYMGHEKGDHWWEMLHELMYRRWDRLEFDRIIPDGFVRMDSRYNSISAEWESIYPSMRIYEHKVRLLLRELEVPIPTPITDIFGVDCKCGYCTRSRQSGEKLYGSMKEIDVKDWYHFVPSLANMD